ncbi:rRNA maturation RNase YbeY [Granulicoccus phenolivorans]|uniref:rRNA maturation RNase YbeY n=1 Tax=Granulicoccus phenolivorans TaxID=266854 RepID=UPI0003FCB773|nr:rRNA maturation RNase YbeY [Granulicoccus phenolivorans]
MSIDLNNESGHQVDEQRLLELATFVLDELRIHPESELSVLLVDEPTMTAYHEKWMNEPGPTDVLSFPMDELRPPRDDDDEPPLGVLGDVVLCPPVTERQAAENGREPQEEAEYLLVHGMLHLLGYDHGTEAEHAEMFGLKDRLIAAWESAQRP